MKRIGLTTLLLLLLTGIGLAETGQPMSDKIVGYWTSSSGTPITIAYSGDPFFALLKINGGPDIKLWLAGGARGGITLDYTAPDGSKMRGSYNEGDDTISLKSLESDFKATWRRNR